MLTQSRTNAVGNFGERHHFACKQMVPAAWVPCRIWKLAYIRQRPSQATLATYRFSASAIADCLVRWKIYAEPVHEQLRRAWRTLVAWPAFCPFVVFLNAVGPWTMSAASLLLCAHPPSPPTVSVSCREVWADWGPLLTPTGAVKGLE